MPSVVQRVIAAGALVLLAPLLLLVAVGVRLTSRGPALYRAQRLSRGRPFTILKFRTMRTDDATHALGITMAGDRRVTPLGRVLRRTKLDELPQLWNVAQGEMLLVGPRPEDPRYVDMTDPLHDLVFNALPGITGPTAVAFRDEESILAEEANRLAAAGGRASATPEDLEQVYREIVLPRKLAMDAEYLRNRSYRGDLAVIGATLRAVLGRR